MKRIPNKTTLFELIEPAPGRKWKKAEESEDFFD